MERVGGWESRRGYAYSIWDASVSKMFSHLLSGSSCQQGGGGGGGEGLALLTSFADKEPGPQEPNTVWK